MLHAALLPLSVLLLLSSPAAAEVMDLTARVRPAVVLLRAEDALGERLGSGTGFFISEDGGVVTNHHVIQKAARMTAVLADGTERRVLGVLASSEEADVAVLQVEGGSSASLPLGDSSRVREGERVMVLGNPLALGWTVSDGIVSAIRSDGLPEEHRPEAAWRQRLLQLTAPTTGGSSGSPVVTLEGRVIGVVMGGFEGKGNLGFAIPVEQVQALLTALPPGAAPKPLQKFPLRNLLVSLGVFAGLGVLLVRKRQRQRLARARWSADA